MKRKLVKTILITSLITLGVNPIMGSAKSPTLLVSGVATINNNMMIKDFELETSNYQDESILENINKLSALDYVSNDDVAVLIDNMEEKEISEVIDDAVVEKISANFITDESIIYGYKNLGISDTETELEIRTEANEEAFVMGKMLDSNVCEILEELEDFYKIKSGEVEGYVKKDNILTGKEANIKATEKMEEVLAIKVDNLVVYSDIYMEKAIMTLNKGDQISYLEKIDDKYKVAIDSIEGYIYVTDDVEVRYTLPTAILLYTAVEKTQMEMVEFATQFIGNPYVWGGTSLTKGTDCSGFTQSIYEKFGITINRCAKDQAKQGEEIKLEDIQPGDLVFYDHNSGSIDHVAMYIGNGQIVHASNKRDGIKISKVDYIRPVVIKRFLNDDNTSY